MIVKFDNKFLNLKDVKRFSVQVDRPNKDVYEVMIDYDNLGFRMDKFLVEKEANSRCKSVAVDIFRGLDAGLSVLVLG